MSSIKTVDRPQADIPPVWPPDDENGGGGDGDGAGGPDFESGFSAGRFGVILIMAGVGMIFFSFVATYIFMRLDEDVWPPVEAAGLPSGMGYGTIIIALSSISVGLGQSALRKAARSRFFVAFAAAMTFGLLFCAMQSWYWFRLLDQGMGLGGNRYASSFFALTALHVAHVIGALCYLAFAWWQVVRGKATPQNHEIVSNAALFWHFVGVIWVALFLVLTYL